MRDTGIMRFIYFAFSFLRMAVHSKMSDILSEENVTKDKGILPRIIR